MKWALKPVAESDSGETTVHEVAFLKRIEAFIKPASLGMSIEDSKQIFTVRVHVLNATLEQAFSTWHTGFRSHVAA